MVKVHYSFRWSHVGLLIAVIGLRLEAIEAGLLGAIGVLGSTVTNGANAETVPSLLNHVVGGVGAPNGHNNLALLQTNNQLQQLQLQQQKPHQNFLTMANNPLYQNAAGHNNAQRPNVAFQQRPNTVIIPNQNFHQVGINNHHNNGQIVLNPQSSVQNQQQNALLNNGIGNLNNMLFNQNAAQSNFHQQPNLNLNNLQQVNNQNFNPNYNQNQNHHLNGIHNPTGQPLQQLNNGVQGFSVQQQLQRPNNHLGGGIPPPTSNVINSGSTTSDNKGHNGAHSSGDHKEEGKDGELHTMTVHEVFFQAKPLIVDDISEDDPEVTLYYKD